jgi:hypothetical protein
MTSIEIEKKMIDQNNFYLFKIRKKKMKEREREK